jgi:hypothetical protein
MRQGRYRRCAVICLPHLPAFLTGRTQPPANACQAFVDKYTNTSSYGTIRLNIVVEGDGRQAARRNIVHVGALGPEPRARRSGSSARGVLICPDAHLKVGKHSRG